MISTRFWRPGNELTSTWAVSTATANTRAAIWYTPNLAARPREHLRRTVRGAGGHGVPRHRDSRGGTLGHGDGDQHELRGRGHVPEPGTGGTSATSFAVAAICGDSDAVTQAFAPSGWTTLHTVTATNGTDHTCDAVLTSAWIASESSSVSVSGTAVSASDLSGVLIEFQIGAASPVPASNNPNWPYLKFEGAFNGGFQTPLDQLTWTDLTPRLWSWDETTGVQYQLGELQATNLTLELDNNDNLLALDNPASYFYGTGWAPQAAFYDELASDQAPLAWWKLADASGTTTAADSSGNSRTATATSITFGNTSEAVTGNTTASLASGSSSHLISSYNPALSAVTVEAWVNLNSLSQSGNPNVLANSHTDSDHKGFELLLTGTTPQVYFGNNTTSGTVKATAALPASGWTYLAGTWDGTTVTLYVNGVSQGTAALSGTMPAGSNNIAIGYNPTTTSNYVNGLIAEAAIYGTALTASQIAAKYMAGPVGTGIPLRIRAAIGTLGGVTVNRWYVIHRNAEIWPQKINSDYRRYIEATATDIWSTMSDPGPTPYRGEVIQDAPYAWWACDDQTLDAGVQPVTLRNSAFGNTNVLNITAASGGIVSGDSYTVHGRGRHHRERGGTDNRGVRRRLRRRPVPRVDVRGPAGLPDLLQHQQPGHRIPRKRRVAAVGAPRLRRRQRLVHVRQRRQLPPAGIRGQFQLLVQRDVLRDRDRVHVHLRREIQHHRAAVQPAHPRDARDLLGTRRGHLPGPVRPPDPGDLQRGIRDHAQHLRQQRPAGRVLAPGDPHHQRQQPGTATSTGASPHPPPAPPRA